MGGTIRGGLAAGDQLHIGLGIGGTGLRVLTFCQVKSSDAKPQLVGPQPSTAVGCD